MTYILPSLTTACLFLVAIPLAAGDGTPPETNGDALVIATGASETELLGDVKHDPYGGHASIG